MSEARVTEQVVDQSAAAPDAVGWVFDPATARAGVLPAQLIRFALEKHWIVAPNLRHSQLQPASLDLSLGTKAYRLQCSFLPDRDSSVDEKLEAIALQEFSIEDGAILERNCAYLIPLQESVALPEYVWARTNPKSSTGRLDVFTRVICDRTTKFDEIGLGYHGQLYLEVVPRSFVIKVRAGTSLNQLRLLTGEPGAARCSDRELSDLHERHGLIYRDGRKVPTHDLDLAEGLFLSVDLNADENGSVGYRAKRNSRVLDMSFAGRYVWSDFWEPVASDRRQLILEPEDFYLLLSREAVSVLPDLAAEMSAYDPTAGELRTHYAGFFDPGFGFNVRRGGPGSRATLEVRARDVPFMIEHGQRICRLVFERLVEETQTLYGRDIGSNYQGQRLTLGKHFTTSEANGQMTFEDAPVTSVRPPR